MARPNKNNAEYFSHDADMRNDVKIKALRRRFSHTGYAVWCYLLETLTDTDFFEVDYRDLNQELLAADFDISIEELRTIVEYCCKINLLQLSEDGTRLYSETHKKRFSGLITKRERDRERLARLVSKREQRDEDIIATKTKLKNSFRSENTHSKVKKSKEENSKVKENRVKNIVYPYQDIVAMWNDVCGGFLPRVKALNDNRRQKIKCRLDEFGGDSKEDWLAHAKELFERIIASDFLRGGNNSGWTATFDWVFENAKNWVKVIEGNYDNNRGARNAQQQRAQSGVTLGIGEYIEPQTGRRTYGTGKATIPPTAPARPSERHSWDAATNSWILL